MGAGKAGKAPDEQHSSAGYPPGRWRPAARNRGTSRAAKKIQVREFPWKIARARYLRLDRPRFCPPAPPKRAQHATLHATPARLSAEPDGAFFLRDEPPGPLGRCEAVFEILAWIGRVPVDPPLLRSPSRHALTETTVTPWGSFNSGGAGAPFSAMRSVSAARASF